MGFTTPWLVVACMVLSTSVSEFCDKAMVERAWKICDQEYIPDKPNGDIDPEEMCQGIDCLIQCRMDAVGDCIKDDEFLDRLHMYDVEKWKVYYRDACSNTTLAAELSGADGRDMGDSCPIRRTCTNQQTSRANLPNLYAEGKYEEYKELLCSTYAIDRNCISVNSTENCTLASAKYYEELVKIGSSVSICENTDLQHLYTRYGGDVKCLKPKVNSKCFSSIRMSKISKCGNISTQIMDFAGDLESSISQFCDSVECNMKCYIDAIGDCDHQDIGIIMDSTSMKVVNRAACDKKEELITIFKACKNYTQNQPCYSELGQGMSDAYTLLDKQNYTAYKNAVCSTTLKFRNCVDYIPVENCTSEMVSLLKDMMDVTYSYATCGTQDHAYFTKYGGDISCDTSASGVPLMNTLLCCILFLAVYCF